VSRRGFGRRLASVLAWSAVLSAALYSGACGPSEETPAAPAGIEDVLYEGGANDEALLTLLASEAKVDPAQGTVFDAPADGASIPSATPPTLKWHVGAPGARFSPLVPGAAGRDSGAFETLRQLVGPLRAASAHGQPVNGRAYFLVFKTASGEAPLRVFTTLLTYTPDAAAWDKLVATGGPITASITGGIFETNRLVPDGGPYSGQPVTFSIASEAPP